MSGLLAPYLLPRVLEIPDLCDTRMEKLPDAADAVEKRTIENDFETIQQEALSTFFYDAAEAIEHGIVLEDSPCYSMITESFAYPFCLSDYSLPGGGVLKAVMKTKGYTIMPQPGGRCYIAVKRSHVKKAKAKRSWFKWWSFNK